MPRHSGMSTYLEIIFAVLVVLGFIFHFLSTWPAPNGFPLARWGWGCWVIASILFFLARG